MIIHDYIGELDWGQITQSVASIPYANFQVPWLPHSLSLEGTSFEELDAIENQAINGDLRLAFFFHFLNISMPLETPFGLLSLPPETPLPLRLRDIQFRPVD